MDNNKLLTIKQEILEYENNIFSNLVENRKKFIDNITSLDFDNFDNKKLDICINDIKEVTDSMIQTSDNIDYYLSNFNNEFRMTQTLEHNKMFKKLFFIYFNYCQ